MRKVLSDVVLLESRDALCHDCVIERTMVWETRPNWWQRFRGARPTRETTVSKWYGHATGWNSGPPSFVRFGTSGCLWFNEMWKWHVKAMKRAGIRGPCKSVFHNGPEAEGKRSRLLLEGKTG
jgi:hypothetical protein